MRRIFTIISIIIISTAAYSQTWVKKAAKSVFTLKTFAADGTMLGSSNGFFIGENGEALSSHAPFVGAVRAVVIDAQGKEQDVECILGANDTYDVVKFRTTARRTTPLPIAQTPATENSTVWLLPYGMKKVPVCTKGTISKAETFNDSYAYYTISMEAPENTVSCPVLNDNGEVVGLLQQPAKEHEPTSYAVSAKFASDLKIKGLSINEDAMKAILIKKALPDELDQATLTLFVMSAGAKKDSAAHEELVNDFIAKFPNSIDGYTSRASLECDRGQFAEAQQDLEHAIKIADKKDEAHFNYAKQILVKETYLADKPYDKWSLDKAAEEADEAYRINPQPAYKQLKAQILYAKKDYEGAYRTYEEMLNDGMRTAEIFFCAAQCKEMQKDTTAMLALLDSTVNTFSKPYLREAAPYLLARAQANSSAGNHRQAVIDFNEYETLMSASLNDKFYYIRSQTELEGRMYQLALNDLAKAIEMSPKNTLYYAEKASIEVTVGLLDEAIATSQECIKLDESLSDGYLFLGLAQCLKGNKDEGIKNLQKASDLGDSQALGLIEKYSQRQSSE